LEQLKFDPAVHVRNDMPRCPICSSNADVYRRKVDPTDLFEGYCETCGGNVRVTESAIEECRRSSKRGLVVGWVRRRSTESRMEVIKRSDIEQVIKDAPSYSVLEKMDLMLSTLAAMTPTPGAVPSFRYAYDWPLVYAENDTEALFFIRELGRLHFLDVEGVVAKLNANGYQRLAEMEKSGRSSVQVFVAMWFDPAMSSVYDEAIEPAIRDAGYLAFRVDRHEHANRIDDEIIAQIKRSRFMVADFTGQRSGVYFEAGFMHGLGRLVIWLCRKDELGKVHFDNRQYNFIDYETVSEARKRLYNRILAIEGEGPGVH
jgi:hypothetical protein